ncbi:MAG: GatB/YqeY domain-containing protein [Candidatus Riflebacteria bacterium]|nr:GatB/YqeY domain-containing protein [Candidatus Riflebacteria bacterium]
MLIDEIKKASLQAMKDRDTTARAIYSVLITKYNNLAIELKAKGQEATDTDLISVIQKTVKELEEELSGWVKANRVDKVAEVDYQEKLISVYLPKQLEEAEIKAIIVSLPDQSIPAVMKHFKANYAGQVDMSVVSRIARNG